MATRSVATKLPDDLVDALDAVSKKTGLRKSVIIEAALREKIEDLLDAEDLGYAVREASGFHPWDEVKRTTRKGRRM